MTIDERSRGNSFCACHSQKWQSRRQVTRVTEQSLTALIRLKTKGSYLNISNAYVFPAKLVRLCTYVPWPVCRPMVQTPGPAMTSPDGYVVRCKQTDDTKIQHGMLYFRRGI
jgi:hypothetical protein